MLRHPVGGGRVCGRTGATLEVRKGFPGKKEFELIFERTKLPNAPENQKIKISCPLV